jgi:hypothetical protein
LSDDGWDDIVVSDHIDDEVDVFINDQDMADDSWTQRSADVSGLDLEDGFAAGTVTTSWGALRDIAFVIQSDQEGQFTQVWAERNPTTFNWEANAQTIMMSPIRESCSVYAAEMLGDGFTEEMVVCEGPFRDNMYILDLGNIRNNFREDVTPHMRGNDLIVFRDHGNEEAWSGLYTSADGGDLGIASHSHRPVIFGSVCLSGRYTDGGNTYAHAMMRNGAGVYIGATEVSLRSSNNAATQMIVDYTDGIPIGQAFRNFERDFLNSPGTLGLSQQEANYWCFEYNLYGDPAFGTNGRPVALYRAYPIFDLFTRETANLQIDTPVFQNDTDGKRVSIPGGYQRFEIGEWIMPYMSYQFDIPYGQTVSSVSVANGSNWNYYNDLYLPPLQEIKPLSNISTRSLEEVDPDDNWDPTRFFEWSVSTHINGNRTLLLKIYPFQYDGSTLRGRFCSDWEVDVDIVPMPVDIRKFEGPGSTSYPEEIVSFRYELEPIGSGGTASISHRIETERGDVLEILSASIIDVNVTTVVRESWRPVGAGEYIFVTEIKDGEGTPIAEYTYPFQVGVVGVSILDITPNPEILGSADYLNVSMTIKNVGNITLEGRYSITIFDPEMGPIDEVVRDTTMGPDEEIVVGAEFDLSGTDDPEYYVRGEFNSVMTGDSLLIHVPRIEEEEEVPVIYTLVIDIEPLPENLSEGDDLWINGTISRNDTAMLSGVAVGIGIIDNSDHGPAYTDLNGTFSVMIPNLPPGNWTISINALVGDWLMERILPISVEPISAGDDDDIVDDDDDDDIVDDDDVVDDDVVDDDITDDDVVDDDVVDDDITDDDAVDDDDADEGTNWSLIGGILIGIILLLLGLLIIIIMARRYKEEEMDWDEE